VIEKESRMARLIVMGAGGVVLAAVAAIAGWWFVIRSDAQLATSPPEIPAALVNATATPGAEATEGVTTSEVSAATVLTFEVNSGLSEAAYFVNEELATLGVPSTAKGSTNQISGAIHLTADGSLAPDAVSQFTVDLRGLTSDEDRRDQRVQETLETSLYPTATFTATSVTGYDASVAESEEQTLQLTGVLDLHGVKKEVTWEVEAYRQGDAISALATVTVAFAEFDMTAPTFGGIVSIDDKATLQVQLIAQAV
jgi:polyisoprenoid-binding protein YceI